MTDRPDQAPSARESATVDGVDVDAVVTAVTSCPSVSGLAAGGLGSAMTLLPGRRVPGVEVSNGEVRVEVRARWGATAATLAREVRAATGPLLAGNRLHVLLADIDTPDAPSPEGLQASAATELPTGWQVPAAPAAESSAAASASGGPSVDSPAGLPPPEPPRSSPTPPLTPPAPAGAAGSEIAPSDRPALPS